MAFSNASNSAPKMVIMGKRDGYLPILIQDFNVVNPVSNAEWDDPTPAICDHCEKHDHPLILEHHSGEPILLKLCPPCFMTLYEKASGEGVVISVNDARMERRHTNAYGKWFKPLVYAALLNGALGYNELEYHRDVERARLDTMTSLVMIFVCAYLAYLILSQVRGILEKWNVMFGKTAESYAKLLEWVPLEYKNFKDDFRETRAGAIREYLEIKETIKQEFVKQRRLQIWQLCLTTLFSTMGTLAGGVTMFMTARAMNNASNVHVFKQEAFFKQTYGFGKFAQGAFAFLGLLATFCGFEGLARWMRDKWASFAMYPDSINFFRFMKRMWRGKPAEFKVRDDIFKDPETAKFFKERFTEYQTADEIPNLNGDGKKTAFSGKFFSLKHEGEYTYPVQVDFHNLKTQQTATVAIFYLYRGDNMDPEVREREVRQALGTTFGAEILVSQNSFKMIVTVHTEDFNLESRVQKRLDRVIRKGHAGEPVDDLYDDSDDESDESFDELDEGEELVPLACDTMPQNVYIIQARIQKFDRSLFLLDRRLKSWSILPFEGLDRIPASIEFEGKTLHFISFFKNRLIDLLENEKYRTHQYKCNFKKKYVECCHCAKPSTVYVTSYANKQSIIFAWCRDCAEKQIFIFALKWKEEIEKYSKTCEIVTNLSVAECKEERKAQKLDQEVEQVLKEVGVEVDSQQIPMTDEELDHEINKVLIEDKAKDLCENLAKLNKAELHVRELLSEIVDNVGIQQQTVKSESLQSSFAKFKSWCYGTYTRVVHKLDQVHVEDVLFWVACVVAGCVISFGTSTLLASLTQPKQAMITYNTSDENFEAKKGKNRKHKKFWLVYGDGENSKFRDNDRVRIHGDDEEYSWKSFYKFANSPEGQQSLFQYHATNGMVHFEVTDSRSGRVRNGHLKMKGHYESVAPEAAVTKRGLPGYKEWCEKDTNKKIKTTDKIQKRLENLKEKVETLDFCSVCSGKKHLGKCPINNGKANTYLNQNEDGTQISLVRELHKEVYTNESILHGKQLVSERDLHGRLGRLLVDGKFVMNCYLHQNKMVVETHGIMENGNLVDKKRIQFRMPDCVLQPIGDFIISSHCEDVGYFPVQPVKSHNRVSLRSAVVGEMVMLVAYDQTNNPTPIFSPGIIGVHGEHTCSSEEGFCTGPLIALKDRAIVGFHCAGGKTVNRCWPVEANMLKFLN